MPTRAAVARTFACATIAAAVFAQPAGAEIVKARTGEKSRLHVNKATAKQLKRQKTKLAAITPAKKSGSTIALPYDLARWDFTTHEGDVTHFTKHIGFRFQRGKRKVAMEHLRLTMDSPKTGYIEALISRVRIKIFNVRTKRIKVTDTSALQVITGYQLKLTTAGADYVNKALHHKSLKRGSIFGTFD